MKLIKLRSRKQENLKKVAISSIVSIILIVLVTTVFVGMILSWSKNSVKEKLNLSTENLKQYSTIECKGVRYTIESCKFNTFNNTIDIILTNNSQMDLFNFVLSINGKNNSGENMTYIGSFKDVIKKGESKALTTGSNNFSITREDDNFYNLDIANIENITLTNGACPDKSISLLDCPFGLPDVLFSLPGGNYYTSQNISLSAPEGSTIYYTTDGTTPTTESSVYESPINVPADSNMQIKAFIVREGFENSTISSATYIISHQLSTPVATPVAGTYSNTKNIVLSGERGSVIYYTIDGSTPTTGSSTYSSPINIPIDTNRTIKALAVKNGFGDSNIYSGSYVITHMTQLATPTPNVVAGFYSTTQNISLSADAGASIYYTINGSTPTTSSTLYTTAINIPAYSSITIKALAVKEDYIDSNVFSGTYIIYRPGRYWVGGTATWDATAGTKWATYPGGPGGASVPTASTDVFFDASSGSGTVSVVTSMVAKDLNCYGYTGALYPATAAATFVIYGSLQLSSTMLFNQGVGFFLRFNGNAVGRTITTAGQTPSYFAFNLSGGDITLQDNVTLNQYWRFGYSGTMSGGTVYANGKTITVSGGGQAFDFYSVSGGTFNMTNSTLNLTVTSVGFSPNLTLVTTGSTINLKGATNTFAGGGKTFNIVSDGGVGGAITFTDANTTISNFNITKATTLTFNAALIIGNFNYSGTAVNTNQVVLGANIAVTGNLNIDGNSDKYRTLVTSSSLGVPKTLTLTGATYTDASYVDFRDITFANGGNNVNLSTIVGGSGNALGNSISGGGSLTLTPGTNVYWHVDAGSWSDSTKWYTATNGGGTHRTVGGVNIRPLPQDNVFFDANSFDSITKTVTVDVSRLGTNIDFSGINRTGITCTFSLATLMTIYGNLIHNYTGSIAGFAYSGYGISFEGRGSHIINLLGSVQSNNSTLAINSYGGQYTLNNNLVLVGIIQVNYGTFDVNDFNVTYASGGGSSILVASGATLYMGNGNWTWDAGYSAGTFVNVSATSTLYSEGSTMIFPSSTVYNAKVFAGGGKTYNNLTISSTGNTFTFTGNNIFNNLTISGNAKTIIFTAGSTQTITGTFTAVGVSGQLYTFVSSTPGTYWIISKASGTVSAGYLNLSDSNATGGATWNASHSLDTNHNTGWSIRP